MDHLTTNHEQWQFTSADLEQWSSQFLRLQLCIPVSGYFLIYVFFKINFYWCIVALQCCVSFWCTAKWISYTYMYMHYFLDFLPTYVTTEHWVEFPVLYSRFSLVIYFIHSSVYMSIPISKFIPPPFLSLVSRICSLRLSLFLLANKFICIIFLDCTYKRYYMILIFLFLTYLTLYDSL